MPRGLVACCLLALASASCGDDGPTSPSEPAPRSLTVVLVPVDSGYQGTAVAAFADGSSRDVTTEAEWTTSNANVATVSSSGRVTLVAPGNVEIRARYQSVSGSAHVSVSSLANITSPPLPPPGTSGFRVFGTIRDALDQQEMQDVLVTVLPQGHTSGRTARTDYGGSYAISEVPEGPATITFAADAYATEKIERTINGDERIDFSLRPLPFALFGTIIDTKNLDAGISCEPVRIELMDGVDAGRFTLQWRDADPPGRYEIPNVQPGTVRIRASVPDFFYPREVTARIRGNVPVDIGLGRSPSPTESRPRCARVEIGQTSPPLYVPFAGAHWRVTFRAAAGQSVTVRFTSTTSRSFSVTLLDPDLRTIATADLTNAPSFDWRSPSLPVTGIYTVVLQPTDTSTDSVTVSVSSP